MSRRHPRIRARLRATLHVTGGEAILVCRTRDVSIEGCFLDTVDTIAPSTEVTVALLDDEVGEAIDARGVVTRLEPTEDDSLPQGVGIRFAAPPPAWRAFVARQARRERPSRAATSTGGRKRVLVAGSAHQRRGALALYVTSGWDVRFASDLGALEEALSGGHTVDAVVAEHDLVDSGWLEVLRAARRLQPDALRVVRSTLRGSVKLPDEADSLVDRLVERDAGLEALLDAIGGEDGYGPPPPPPA